MYVRVRVRVRVLVPLRVHPLGPSSSPARQGIITRRNFLESHHKPHVKQTTFELKTMRLFMQPLPAPTRRLTRPSLFNDPDLVGDGSPLREDAPARTVDLDTGMVVPATTLTEYDMHNYGETSV